MPHPKRLLETLEAFQIRRYKNGPRKTTKTKSIPKWTSKGNATDQSFPFLTSKIRNDSPNGSHSCLTSILHGAHNIPSMNSDCSPVSIIKAIQWSTRSQRLEILYTSTCTTRTLRGPISYSCGFKTGIVRRKSRVKVENDSPARDL
jgi:hypothetical protein